MVLLLVGVALGLELGGGYDEILAGFSFWCKLQRESRVPGRVPTHHSVVRGFACCAKRFDIW